MKHVCLNKLFIFKTSISDWEESQKLIVSLINRVSYPDESIKLGFQPLIFTE